MQVTVRSGTVYSARKVIVTVSLGYLQQRHSQLFTPSLPSSKVQAMSGLVMGVLDKVRRCHGPHSTFETSLVANFHWHEE